MKLLRWTKALMIVAGVVAVLVVAASAQAESGCHRNDTGPKGSIPANGQSN